jgi:hypothetical protein
MQERVQQSQQQMRRYQKGVCVQDSLRSSKASRSLQSTAEVRADIVAAQPQRHGASSTVYLTTKQIEDSATH